MLGHKEGGKDEELPLLVTSSQPFSLPRLRILAGLNCLRGGGGKMSIIPIDKPKQTLLVLLSYWWYSLWLKMTMMLMPTASTTLKICVCVCVSCKKETQSPFF